MLLKSASEFAQDTFGSHNGFTCDLVELNMLSIGCHELVVILPRAVENFVETSFDCAKEALVNPVIDSDGVVLISTY